MAWLWGCSSNVKPGDSDYPTPNPHPKHFFLFHGTTDPSLDVKFRIFWRAANRDCHYVGGLIGVYNDYTVEQPLEVHREGSDFSAKIVTDGVLPGRCGWEFGGIYYIFETPDTSKSVVLNPSYLFSSPLKPNQSPNGVTQFYCKKKVFWSKQKEGILARRLHYKKPSKKKVSVLECGPHETLWWQPETKDVEVHFNASIE